MAQPSQPGAPAAPDDRGPRLPRALVAAIGAVYVVLGVIGLIQTGVDTTTGSPSVGGLGGTVVLNAVHTVAGLLALGASTGRRWTRLFGRLGGVFFLGLVAYGVVDLMLGTESELGIDWPATVLHALTVAVCVIIALHAPPVTKVDETGF